MLWWTLLAGLVWTAILVIALHHETLNDALFTSEGGGIQR